MCLENRPRRSEKVYYHGDNGSLGCVDWIHGWSEAGIFLLPWWLETIMLGTEIQIGNSGLISAWAVVQMGSQATEIPLLEVGKYASVQVRSFWDTRSFGKRNRIEPIYAMLNSSDSPLKYWATVTSAHGRRITYEGKLNPHARYILSPMRNKGNWKAGSITIRHSGMPGDLLSIGLLHGDSFLNPIPVFDVATLVSNRYHSVRVPIKTAGSLGNVIPMQALLSAFNPTRRSQRALLTVFDPETGEELASHDGVIAPGEVETLNITELLTRDDKRIGGDSVRVAIEHSGRPGTVLLAARSVSANNQVIYVPLMAESSAHHNGMYPLPPLDTHSVVTTLTNLGSIPARIGGQINWEDGSYIFPLIDIAPGASHRIDIAELAKNGEPDIFGNSLDPDYENGVLRWGYFVGTATLGSTTLIARTEVHIIGGGHVGFNCTGCCWENPYGDILPGSVTFETGSSPYFEAVVVVLACSGPNGVYHAEVTSTSTSVPSPFSWNEYNVSASDAGSATISFTGLGQYFVYGECFLPLFVGYSGTAGATAKPKITSVTGPAKVPLRQGETGEGDNSIQLQASVNPTGGTFEWTTTSSKVSLSNTSQATVTVTSVSQSSSRDDVPIKLKYTKNGQFSEWQGTLTVVKPASLSLNSNTYNGTSHTCDPNASSDSCGQSSFTGNGTYSSYRRDRVYRVMDHLPNPEWISGFSLYISESYTTPSGPCSGSAPIIGSGFGDTVTDCFYFCAETCRTGGSCSVSSTQTINVNGFAVGTNSVTWTCSDATVTAQ